MNVTTNFNKITGCHVYNAKLYFSAIVAFEHSALFRVDGSIGTPETVSAMVDFLHALDTALGVTNSGFVAVYVVRGIEASTDVFYSLEKQRPREIGAGFVSQLEDSDLTCGVFVSPASESIGSTDYDELVIFNPAGPVTIKLTDQASVVAKLAELSDYVILSTTGMAKDFDRDDVFDVVGYFAAKTGQPVAVERPAVVAEAPSPKDIVIESIIPNGERVFAMAVFPNGYAHESEFASESEARGYVATLNTMGQASRTCANDAVSAMDTAKVAVNQAQPRFIPCSNSEVVIDCGGQWSLEVLKSVCANGAISEEDAAKLAAKCAQAAKLLTEVAQAVTYENLSEILGWTSSWVIEMIEGLTASEFTKFQAVK